MPTPVATFSYTQPNANTDVTVLGLLPTEVESFSYIEPNASESDVVLGLLPTECVNIRLTPGLTANGDPTTLANNSIPYLQVESSDNWDFVIQNEQYCAANTAGPPILTTFTVLNSSGTGFDLERTVLNSSGTGFDVISEALNSSGSPFEVI